MNKILKVFTNDMKKISTNVIAVVIILGLSILPSLYAWFNIFPTGIHMVQAQPEILR